MMKIAITTLLGIIILYIKILNIKEYKYQI